jgi:hypothetical protein
MYSPGCHLPIPTQLGLNNLDFSGYNKIWPDIAHFEVHFANFGAFWPFQGQLGAPGDPKPIFLNYV